MKIQNLAIIFLVIIIPLVMILSYYLHLQQKTLELQAEYDTKLSEATKEGIKAFEVNTVDWSEKEGRKKTSLNNREEAEAIISAFTTSLANNLNIAGTAKEYMLNYIPAIAITMYDGYYVYAPSYVPVTAETEEGIQLFYDVSSGGSNSAIIAGDLTRESEDKILYVAETGGERYFYEYVVDATSGYTETKTYEGLTTDPEKAKKEYEHTLNNKTAYCAKYKKRDKHKCSYKLYIR